MKTTSLFAAIILLGSAGMTVLADGATTHALANILLNLEHKVSAEDEITLQAIVTSENTSTDEKTVATALLNLNHTVIEVDRSKLQSIIDNSEAEEDVKTLSIALMGMKHRLQESTIDYENVKNLVAATTL